MSLPYILALIACCVVALILMRGLWNMMSNGPANTSQKLMRMRVAAQAVAILVIVIVVWATR